MTNRPTNYAHSRLAIVFLAFLIFCALAACTKDPVFPATQAPQEPLDVYDWASGSRMFQVVRNNGNSNTGLMERSIREYDLYMGEASYKYGYQVNIYRAGTLAQSSSWIWVTPMPGYTFIYDYYDSAEYEYRFDAQFQRKVPSIPVTLPVYWGSYCDYALTDPENITIPVEGIMLSHVFKACE